MVQEFLVALGSNLGLRGDNALKTVQNSIQAVRFGDFKIRRVSRFFVTPCFPQGAGPDYVNACIAIASPLAPDAVLRQLHAVEAQFDRVRDKRWGGRSLDLDLLAVGKTIRPSRAEFTRWHDLELAQQMQSAPDQLILPHPRIQDRAFVLVPLCDIAPDWCHPVLGQTVQQLHDALPEQTRAEVVPVSSL